MASCSASELQALACDNNFTSLASEEALSRAVELEQLYLIAVETTTLSELYAQACVNGFDKVASMEGLSNAIELQQLCNIAGGTDDDCDEPVAPTDFSVVSNAVDLEWAYGADPSLDFLIQYGTTPGGPYTQSQSVSAAVRNHLLSGLASSTLYYLIIRARTSETCFSSPSNEDFIFTL